MCVCVCLSFSRAEWQTDDCSLRCFPDASRCSSAGRRPPFLSSQGGREERKATWSDGQVGLYGRNIPVRMCGCVFICTDREGEDGWGGGRGVVCGSRRQRRHSCGVCGLQPHKYTRLIKQQCTQDRTPRVPADPLSLPPPSPLPALPSLLHRCLNISKRWMPTSLQGGIALFHLGRVFPLGTTQRYLPGAWLPPAHEASRASSVHRSPLAALPRVSLPDILKLQDQSVGWIFAQHSGTKIQSACVLFQEYLRRESP